MASKNVETLRAAHESWNNATSQASSATSPRGCSFSPCLKRSSAVLMRGDKYCLEAPLLTDRLNAE
jgi:hypothetical protein